MTSNENKGKECESGSLKTLTAMVCDVQLPWAEGNDKPVVSSLFSSNSYSKHSEWQQ